jgi:hypothetical protein
MIAVSGNNNKINTTITSYTGEYKYACLTNGLKTFFKEFSGLNGGIKVEKDELYFAWQPRHIGYEHVDQSLDIIADAINASGIVNENKISYSSFPDIIDEYIVLKNKLKHNLILNSLPDTPSNNSQKSTFNFGGYIEYPNNASLIGDGEEQIANFTTSSTIKIKDDKGNVIYLLAPYAYEQNNPMNKTMCQYEIKRLDNQLWLHIKTPYSWLSSPEREYPVIVDPTATIDTSTVSDPTRYSNQRKIFYNGSYYWCFYYDGSNTVYEYSDDGTTWGNTANQAFFLSNVNQASIWYDSSNNVVYAVGDRGALYASDDVYVRKGTVSETSIEWGTQSTADIGNKNVGNKVAFISQDSSGYLWIVSSQKEASPSSFNCAAVRSTNTDDVSSWGTYTNLMNVNIADHSIYPIILPLSGGDMYAIWYNGTGGKIEGKKYASGSWSGTVDSIATTSTLVSTKTPSAVVDSSYNIHLIYSDSNGDINYTKYTTSWSAATELDGNDDNLYPTISLDTSNNDLYAFWINSSNQIHCKKWGGSSWTAITLDTDTTSKNYITSIYNYSSASQICWEWGEGTSTPWDVNFDRIPEFPSIAVPIVVTVVIFIFFRKRSKKDVEHPKK